MRVRKFNFVIFLCVLAVGLFGLTGLSLVGGGKTANADEGSVSVQASDELSADRIYVSNSGNNNSDGLSASNAVASLNTAFLRINSNAESGVEINTIVFLDTLVINASSGNGTIVNNTGKNIYLIRDDSFSGNSSYNNSMIALSNNAGTFTFNGDDASTDTEERFIFEGRKDEGVTVSSGVCIHSAASGSVALDLSHISFQNFSGTMSSFVRAVGNVNASNLTFSNNEISTTFFFLTKLKSGIYPLV